MPLVQAKCTNCGANLEVENTKDAAICPHCGTPYVVEKAINNFNTVNHISADIVNVYGGNSADFVIRAGKLEKYNGAATEVVIPNSVTCIGHHAFYGCGGLTSITISDTVTSIDESAFHSCSGLTSVTIPNSVTIIGRRAFSGCSGLTSVTIPGRVAEIGQWAFSGCSGLTSVTISDGVANIAYEAFANCVSLTDLIIPSSVVKIEKSAFLGCRSLKEVTIQGNPRLLFVYGDNDGRTQASPTYDIFGGCSSLVQINASEEWKNENWKCAKCLSSYGPPQLPQSKSGCYIATAVYGSYDCPQVWTLRRYRDNVLANYWYGKAFIRCYYAISPKLVRWFGNKKWFQSFWRRKLNQIIHRLNAAGTANTPYNDNNK